MNYLRKPDVIRNKSEFHAIVAYVKSELGNLLAEDGVEENRFYIRHKVCRYVSNMTLASIMELIKSDVYYWKDADTWKDGKSDLQHPEQPTYHVNDLGEHFYLEFLHLTQDAVADALIQELYPMGDPSDESEGL